MAEVFNWQLQRTMKYQYEEVRPQKQIAWVFDTNKCIDCQTCTIACKQTWTWGTGQEYMLWNNVETKPYGFYPMAWDVKLMELIGGTKWEGNKLATETVFEQAPAGERVKGFLFDSQHWASPNIGEDEPIGVADKGTYIDKLPHSMWFSYLARICNHCSYPACLAACPREAIYKRPEDGIVLVDQDRCRGYQECASACPYKKVMYNPEDRVSQKCIGCYPKIEQGEQPQCVVSCIGRIRMAGFISPPGVIDPTNPIDYMVKVKKVALPLYPQSGTEPNVYYIPPVHADREYTRQMFGPGLDEAIAAYQKTKSDPELLGLFMLFGSTEKIIRKFAVQGETATGYDDKGAEVVRVPVREPSVVRDYFDRVHESYLHNIT